MATLLFVDDNDMLRTFAARNLESDIPSLRVVAASSCEQARHLAGQHRPDVIIMDQRLTDGNGLDLMRELYHTHPEARVVVVSADTGPSLRERALASGALEVLTKPYETEALVSAVRRAMSKVSSSDHPQSPQTEPPDRTSEWQQRVKHRAMNRLSALLAGLRAMEADLEDAADEGESVRQVMDRYFDRLRGSVQELSELVNKLGSEEQE